MHRIHRDIKAGNILLTEDAIVKLGNRRKKKLGQALRFVFSFYFP